MKTILITGATSGIGKATAKQLSAMGHKVVMLIRNLEKGEELKQQIADDGNVPPDLIHCDLVRLQSVKTAAAQIVNNYKSIDVLINNAGGIFQSKYETPDGLELSFQVNHLGHFLLTNELLPVIKNNNGGRIINVSSEAHKFARPDFNDLQMSNGYSGSRQYGNVKLYNIYFTQELADRYGNEGITANAVHPGGVNTNFDQDMKGLFKLGWNIAKPFLRSPAKGAETSVFVATSDELKNVTGQYFKDKKIAPVSKLAENTENRKLLWEESEKLVNRILNQKEVKI